MTSDKFKAIRRLTNVDNYWLRLYLDVDPDILQNYSNEAAIPEGVAENMYAFYGSFQNAALGTCDVLSKVTPTKLLTFENSEALYNFEDLYNLDHLARLVSSPISGSLYKGLIYAIEFLMLVVHEQPIEIVQWGTLFLGEPQILSTTNDSVKVVGVV